MAFSFGFSGEDIELDPDEEIQDQNVQEQGQSNADVPPPIPAKAHDLDELLSTLPSKISYTTTTITSPQNHTIRLPRRTLIDIRLQLMSEDDLTPTRTHAGLSTTDRQHNIYEGGYKTWECSLDLVRYLLDRGPRKDLDDLVRVGHVLELGCGSALPSLVLFGYAIRNELGMCFTLADYNEEVLRLVCLPNLVLMWVLSLDREARRDVLSDGPQQQHQQQDEQGDEEETDLHLTPHLLQTFKSNLNSLNITLTLLSGSWTPTAPLLSLIPSAPHLNTFILASETIYSLSSLDAFTDAMVGVLSRVKEGKAVVAAKRVYFGVGGSVDAFREACARRGCVVGEVRFEGLGEEGEGGVRRCLVEVQMY
ncbi:hypothetical protein BDW02DRAFT_629363 [Decorospora gaudefroyi]|uniref:protein-histidine N-methyltransferase n=1 Tax=Decorospora gaudefroyi TaxID=184978 RepID=A0A6A5KPZ0_9PLEO|nr:hypothetical protein BDW02DRAFT_629363 [Decorospora gaudefroyi]